jgi:hypothetical protein
MVIFLFFAAICEALLSSVILKPLVSFKKNTNVKF